jgi:hypothetical protein
VLHFGHIVGLSVFQNLGDTHAKDSLEKERLLGKLTAEAKPPSYAVADAPPRAAVPKVTIRLERNYSDPGTVFLKVPGDLLGDASNHNAPAFKHCQRRA